MDKSVKITFPVVIFPRIDHIRDLWKFIRTKTQGRTRRIAS